MKIQDIQINILRYIEAELMPSLSGLNKFMMCTASILGADVIERLVIKYYNTLKMLDIIKENDEIDIEKLYQASKVAMKNSEKIEFMNFVFRENDIDIIYKYLKGER